MMRALLLGMLLAVALAGRADAAPLGGLGRFDGWRDNALIGYGLVTGLSGSGDTRRSAVTRQALRNVLSRLGANVTEDQISSRNVAVVMVTATLPASANVGDRIDVAVSSVGDARSLAGGTLLMTPLLGPDRVAYALAQGAVTAGGHQFEANLNSRQRNYPTSATLTRGATVERAVDARLLSSGGLSFLLSEPNFTTAQRIAERIVERFGAGAASVENADAVRIRFTGPAEALAGFVAELEALSVEPAAVARIVINERTGTVVAGAEVRISAVTVSQGDLRVSVNTENEASQPGFIDGLASDIGSLVVTNTRLDIEQGNDRAMTFPSSTVADLVQGLARAGVDTRRIISILQAVKASGALHGEILVQ